MDNFEDNHVETLSITSQPDTENQVDEWIQQWSSYILGAPYNTEPVSDSAKQLVQQLLLAAQQGDSCLLVNQHQVMTLGQMVQNSAYAENSVIPFVHDGERLYLYRYWSLEQQLSDQVLRLKQQTLEAVNIEAYQELLTDPFQRQALQMSVTQSLNIITGGPGTGKTYTLARIIAVLNQTQPGLRIALAAPTGKAAQRMKEALQNSLNDPKLTELASDELKQLTPVTIHRLLGLGTGQKPRYHARQPLPYDVIVVDEASMLDLSLAQMLLAAVSSQARLILLGDANQLASVDVGSVLADLQQVTALAENRVHLVNSRRFGQDALIGKMAAFIQQQAEQPDADVLKAFSEQIAQPGIIQPVALSKDMQDVVQLEYLPSHRQTPAEWSECYDRLMYGYSTYADILSSYVKADHDESMLQQIVTVFDDYRILTAIRHGESGVHQLNLQITKRLLERPVIAASVQGDWFTGRPVMMTYNDYQLGLSNGDIGICLNRIRNGSAQFEVYFPSLDKWVAVTRLPKNIETAFALTIHKSQGSEFRHTAVVLDGNATKLLSRELLYTAITRAKNTVTLLVNADSFVQALSVQTCRNSGLLAKVNQKLNC
ncbi:exodeoxyribonuclease V subunit alpha [Acinetobacter chinensis]|uniref:RecBCD enzyme subunit RecD n=1 Tax=Acinetobacter chinensis TaxID=2004650 RepID=A0A3B7LS13_9GAMM|nr:exodeoxyribonuclease V subunit alpha [Acinetobacter chinensis]